ncbi:MAG: hypothetical protein KBA38_07075 [Negativicutes bacterium]|nr:hypothetical protein [Negativicutes bacterium]
MLYSAFVLSIVGTALGVIALLLFFLIQNKTKKIQQLTIDLLDLKELTQNQAEKLNQLENTVKELRVIQANMNATHHSSQPVLEIFSDDTQWTRTGKHWAKKAYDNPETAIGILASGWTIVRKLFKEK